MSTDSTHTFSPTGPITLDLTQASGRIGIAVNPLAKALTVIVTTDSDTGLSADAVRDATFTEAGGRLTVNVPMKGGGGSNITVSGGNVMSFGGGSISVGAGSGSIIINGVDVTEIVNKGSKATEVVTSVVLPAGSEVLLSTHTANVTVRGELRALDYGASSGRLDADTVGEFSMTLSSGDARVKHVTGSLDATLTSGDLVVDSYSGSSARLSLTSGDATVHATSASSGKFNVSLTSGSARITGTGHLDVRRRVTSGNLRVS